LASSISSIKYFSSSCGLLILTAFSNADASIKKDFFWLACC